MDSRPRLETLEKQLSALYSQSYSKVVAFFRIRRLPDTVCEDMAQTTFLKAFDMLSSYRGDQVVMTWIYQIAESKFKNYLRDQKAQKRDAPEISTEDSLAPELSATNPTAFEALAVKEQMAILERCIPEMPQKMRACFTLFFIDQRTQVEIAQIMKVKANTVKSHIHQAREHLKACAARFGG